MLLTSNTKTSAALMARTVADIQLVHSVLLRPTVITKAMREEAAVKIQVLVACRRTRSRVSVNSPASGRCAACVLHSTPLWHG